MRYVIVVILTVFSKMCHVGGFFVGGMLWDFFKVKCAMPQKSLKDTKS